MHTVLRAAAMTTGPLAGPDPGGPKHIMDDRKLLFSLQTPWYV